jgi:hypothetical protein
VAAVNPSLYAQAQLHRVLVLQAQQRQQNFAQSAVGRAAYKSEKEVRKPIKTERGDTRAEDWLT